MESRRSVRRRLPHTPHSRPRPCPLKTLPACGISTCGFRQDRLGTISAGETKLQPRFSIIEPRRANLVRAVIFFAASATAGTTAAADGNTVLGLLLAIGGSFYVLFTSFSGILDQADSPHHTAVTAGDILLITAIVWLTGGVHSEFYLLYYLPVLGAGLRLNARDGIAACLLAGGFYALVSLAGQSHPSLVVPAAFRLPTVCVSAAVGVVLFALLNRQVRICDSLGDTLHSSLGRVAAIYDVAHAANTGAELASLLSILLDHAARMTRAANGCIFLVTPERTLQQTASLSSPAGDDSPVITFPDEPAHRAIANGSPVILGPDRQTPGPHPPADRTLVYVPLGTPARPVGVCALASRAGRKFSRTNIEFLKSLCSEAALAIENAKLRADLRRLAITDHLTGLPSRREVERRLLAELNRSGRSRIPLALLMIDVDNLKPVNDDLGHAAGDELLRVLGHTLQTGIRATDAAGRIGGDEFIVVLPDTDAEQGQALADHLIEAFQREISEFQGPDDSPPLPPAVGISVGVAVTSDGRTSAKALIDSADSALYQAKGAGKNVSRVAAEPEPVAAPGLPPADAVTL